MKSYADTHCLTQLYLKAEPGIGIGWVERMRQADSGRLPITWLHRLELINALEFSVWLGKQGGHPRVSAEQASVAAATFRDDLAAQGFLRSERVEPEALERSMEDLTLRYTAKHGFRAYDILHVAFALALGCDTFWSFDSHARKLAALEGLSTPQ